MRTVNKTIWTTRSLHAILRFVLAHIGKTEGVPSHIMPPFVFHMADRFRTLASTRLLHVDARADCSDVEMARMVTRLVLVSAYGIKSEGSVERIVYDPGLLWVPALRRKATRVSRPRPKPLLSKNEAKLAHLEKLLVMREVRYKRAKRLLTTAGMRLEDTQKAITVLKRRIAAASTGESAALSNDSFAMRQRLRREAL